MECIKAMRIEKFLLLNVYVGKIECSQINKLFSYKISKEEQKKIYMQSEGNNEDKGEKNIENRKTIENNQRNLKLVL